MQKKAYKYLLVASLIIIATLYIHHKMIMNKCSDITYAAEHYATSGIFNNNKLYEVDSYNLRFSDNHKSIMIITGISNKVPHEIVTYKLTMIKNNSGIWSVSDATKIPTENTDDKDQ